MKHFSWPDISAETPHSIWIRTAAPRDVESLTEHFSILSQPSRYNRFMGAVSNFSRIALDCLIHGRKGDRFTLVAEMRGPAREAIIGEASYGFDSDAKCGEF